MERRKLQRQWQPTPPRLPPPLVLPVALAGTGARTGAGADPRNSGPSSSATVSQSVPLFSVFDVVFFFFLVESHSPSPPHPTLPTSPHCLTYRRRGVDHRHLGRRPQRPRAAALPAARPAAPPQPPAPALAPAVPHPPLAARGGPRAAQPPQRHGARGRPGRARSSLSPLSFSQRHRVHPSSPPLHGLTFLSPALAFSDRLPRALPRPRWPGHGPGPGPGAAAWGASGGERPADAR